MIAAIFAALGALQRAVADSFDSLWPFVHLVSLNACEKKMNDANAAANERTKYLLDYLQTRERHIVCSLQQHSILLQQMRTVLFSLLRSASKRLIVFRFN
jgi:hypothetical protein